MRLEPLRQAWETDVLSTLAAVAGFSGLTSFVVLAQAQSLFVHACQVCIGVHVCKNKLCTVYV